MKLINLIFITSVGAFLISPATYATPAIESATHTWTFEGELSQTELSPKQKKIQKFCKKINRTARNQASKFRNCYKKRSYRMKQMLCALKTQLPVLKMMIKLEKISKGRNIYRLKECQIAVDSVMLTSGLSYFAIGEAEAQARAGAEPVRLPVPHEAAPISPKKQKRINQLCKKINRLHNRATRTCAKMKLGSKRALCYLRSSIPMYKKAFRLEKIAEEIPEIGHFSSPECIKAEKSLYFFGMRTRRLGEGELRDVNR